MCCDVTPISERHGKGHSIRRKNSDKSRTVLRANWKRSACIGFRCLFLDQRLKCPLIQQIDCKDGSFHYSVMISRLSTGRRTTLDKPMHYPIISPSKQWPGGTFCGHLQEDLSEVERGGSHIRCDTEVSVDLQVNTMLIFTRSEDTGRELHCRQLRTPINDLQLQSHLQQEEMKVKAQQT